MSFGLFVNTFSLIKVVVELFILFATLSLGFLRFSVSCRIVGRHRTPERVMRTVVQANVARIERLIERIR